MKLSFASLFVMLLLATVMVVGCSDSATVSQPDTTPPLAPVVVGAKGTVDVVSVWWQQNIEPDLAGYNVYVVENGSTVRLNRLPITDPYMVIPTNGATTMGVRVTALDWSGNESSPSAQKTVNISYGQTGRDGIDGLQKQEMR